MLRDSGVREVPAEHGCCALTGFDGYVGLRSPHRERAQGVTCERRCRTRPRTWLLGLVRGIERAEGVVAEAFHDGLPGSRGEHVRPMLEGTPSVRVMGMCVEQTKHR